MNFKCNNSAAKEQLGNLAAQRRHLGKLHDFSFWMIKMLYFPGTSTVSLYLSLFFME
jgi:hypothetical protein